MTLMMIDGDDDDDDPEIGKYGLGGGREPTALGSERPVGGGWQSQQIVIIKIIIAARLETDKSISIFIVIHCQMRRSILLATMMSVVSLSTSALTLFQGQ